MLDEHKRLILSQNCLYIEHLVIFIKEISEKKRQRKSFNSRARTAAEKSSKERRKQQADCFMYTHNIHLYSHSCVDRGSRHLCLVFRSVNNIKLKSIIKKYHNFYPLRCSFRIINLYSTLLYKIQNSLFCTSEGIFLFSIYDNASLFAVSLKVCSKVTRLKRAKAKTATKKKIFC